MPSDCQCSTSIERVIVKMPRKEVARKISILEEQLRVLQEENIELKKLLKRYLNNNKK
jgi:hypothetical protein